MSTDSILSSVKKTLGILPEHKPFDDEIMTHINSALFTLRQLGLGPSQGFRVESDAETWTQFFVNAPEINVDVVQYVALKVRMAFDPPDASHVLTAYSEMVKELEWRINVQREETQWASP